jgi:signal recognition particle subunit SRP54
MLGMGDISGLMEKLKEVPQSEESQRRVLSGEMSLRDLYENLQSIMKMGPLSKVMEMVPGMSNLQLPGSSEDKEKGLRKMLCILDSMTDEELDSDGRILISQPTRILRIAKGSGHLPHEINVLLQFVKGMSKMMQSLGGGKGGLFSSMAKQKGGMPNPQQLALFQQQMSRMGGPMGDQLREMMRQVQAQGINLKDLFGSFGGS